MLQKKLNDTTQTYSSSNCVFVSDVKFEQSSEILNHISEKYSIKDIKVTSMPYVDDDFSENAYQERIIPAMSASVLVVNGKEYKFSESIGRLYDLNEYIAIEYFDLQYSMITEYELAEYDMINGRDDPLLYGEIPRGNKEILIPECYAEAYNTSAEELVGKDITIKLIGENSEITLIDNYKED